ncbi:MAG TPA: undecaprenyl-diphosphate phosphatase [Candidatus Scatomonas pullistercoris]|uniref:Undecaprenyl-diphosphatase n=1 Tax=Candidatus Scatomonas pullistercoris TaxID=2840920 RepID=A0A9D1P388_9FIRM|nr:undecaprenyl-diphosphate phosphatase [Candidatus Scatomonas pullistercoris]
MEIFEWFKVVILGIVEGITEWLPISSTGHLVLVGEVVKLDASQSFIEMFNVVIQLGAILAVVVLYFKKLWPFHTRSHEPARSWFANPAESGAAAAFQRFANRHLYMDKIVMWLKIAVSCLPAIIIGLPLDDWVEEHMHRPVPIAAMLIIYGVLFIIIENYNRRRSPRITRISQISWADALLIGIFQVLAIIPGTSRSGATIVGGILIGMSRTLAAEYTFYLAVPTMLGASAMKLVKFGLHFTSVEAATLILGMAVAFLVSILAIKFLMSYIKRHDFKVFGWYRIVLGALVLVLFAAGFLRG